MTSNSFPARHRAVAFVLSALVLGPFATSAQEPIKGPEVDEKAAALAAEVMEALGGQEAWQDARFFRLTFAGFRTHWWDKHTGRHRLEYTDRDGNSYIVISNVVTREGQAIKGVNALEGEERAEVLERTYDAWINDFYWLLAPYKLRDPGVTLTHDGSETIDEKSYEKLQLSFDGVGLTPGDRYWFYVDPETKLPARWAYVLESYEEGRPATHWIWSGWKSYGGLMLASDRVNPDGGRELPMTDLAVARSMPDSIFESFGVVTWEPGS